MGKVFFDSQYLFLGKGFKTTQRSYDIVRIANHLVFQTGTSNKLCSAIDLFKGKRF